MNGRRLAVLLSVTAAFILGPRSQQGAQQSEYQVLEGRVVSRGALEPIPGVAVVLTRLNPNTPQNPEAMELAQNVAIVMANPLASLPGFVDGFLKPGAERIGVDPELVRPLSQDAVVTDAAGAFSFKNLPPGAYSVSAQKEGFYVLTAGDYSTSLMEAIRIETGKRPDPMELIFAKGGIVSGRVRDPRGQPVSNISIVGDQLSYPNGRAVILNSSSSKPTNDRGEFRLYWLPPGQYYIEATPKVPGSVPGPQDTWLRTFHPAASDPAAAVPITITDGAEISGIDIDIRESTSLMYTISGTAMNPNATRPVEGARGNVPAGALDRTVTTFFLTPREPSMLDGVSPTVQNALPVTARPNGEFEIRNVRPGYYDLYAAYLNLNSHRYFLDQAPVDVKGGNITGLSMTLRPGSTLVAETLVEGTPQIAFKMESLRLNLSTMDLLPVLVASVMTDLQFDKEGKLTAKNVPDHRYAASLSGLPPGAYIADIRQGDRSVYDEGIVVGPQAALVQIMVNPSGATIKGRVQTGEHQPVSNADVILVPPEPHRKNAELFRIAKTDKDGRFSVSGIMPGTYSVFALRQHPSRQPWLNADFLAKYQDRWMSLDMRGNASSEIDLEPLSN